MFYKELHSIHVNIFIFVHKLRLNLGQEMYITVCNQNLRKTYVWSYLGIQKLNDLRGKTERGSI